MEDIYVDMDSTSHPIYDMYDGAYMIVLRDDELGEGAPKHEEGLAWDELIVEDDFISHEEDNKGDEVINEILYEDNDLDESIDPLCDDPHHTNEMTLHDFESQLLVIEENIMQVFMRGEGADRFIEDLM